MWGTGSMILSVLDPQMVERIVSGGQTGADRAALDWAIANNVPHGGWCPKGRAAEDGVLAEKYQLTETESAGYPPDLQEEAVKTVLMQAELLCGGWA